MAAYNLADKLDRAVDLILNSLWTTYSGTGLRKCIR